LKQPSKALDSLSTALDNLLCSATPHKRAIKYWVHLKRKPKGWGGKRNILR